MSVQEITLEEASVAVEHIIKTNPRQAVMLWGLPGVGKSALVRQMAARYEVPVIDWRLSQMDPPDVRGIPSVVKGKTVFHPPVELPTDSKSEGFLFLDEINAAPRATMASAMQLVLDRKLGTYEVPPGWIILAAGNEVSHGAVANRMPTALANRFVHFRVRPDLDTLVRYGLRNNWEPTILQFLRFRPDLLHQMKTSADVSAFPSPRSWEFVNNSGPLNIDSQALRTTVIESAVGTGAALEFEGFISLFPQLPSFEEIMLSPQTAKLPDKPDGRYAIASVLLKKVDVGTIEQTLIYLDRMETEFSALLIKDITAHKKQLTQTIPVVNWMANHADFFMLQHNGNRHEQDISFKEATAFREDTVGCQNRCIPKL